MGLIHSRAAKQRNRAEAAVLNEQARQLGNERRATEHDQRAAAAGDNPWRQPTVGDAIKTFRRNRQQD